MTISVTSAWLPWHFRPVPYYQVRTHHPLQTDSLEVGKPVEKPTTNKSYLVATELAQKLADGEELADLIKEDKYAAAYHKHSRMVQSLAETLQYQEYKIQALSQYQQTQLQSNPGEVH